MRRRSADELRFVGHLVVQHDLDGIGPTDDVEVRDHVAGVVPDESRAGPLRRLGRGPSEPVDPAGQTGEVDDGRAGALEQLDHRQLVRPKGSRYGRRFAHLGLRRRRRSARRAGRGRHATRKSRGHRTSPDRPRPAPVPPCVSHSPAFPPGSALVRPDDFMIRRSDLAGVGVGATGLDERTGARGRSGRRPRQRIAATVTGSLLPTVERRVRPSRAEHAGRAPDTAWDAVGQWAAAGTGSRLRDGRSP